MKRTLILIVLMVASCAAANRTLAVLQTHTNAGSLVNTTSPQVTLPGTIYVAQQGAIFAIKGTSVRRLPLPSGGAWIQPRTLPDGSLLVVRRFEEYSDLYHVSASGRVLSKMTSDYQSSVSRTLQLNHWILWPAVSPDGATVFFATDAPKPAPRQSYEVDFSLWSAPVGGPIAIGDAGVAGGTRWSVPDAYTGGDIEPIPLPDGDILYASYANSGKGQVQSVLGLQTGPRSRMVSLTSPAQDCGSPAVAADGATVAMVCTNGGQTADLEVATLEGATLSAPRVLVPDCLCNSPSWSTSGTNLLYMDASDPDGNFGLWYIAAATNLHPRAPRRVTDTSVDLDATSAATWIG